MAFTNAQYVLNNPTSTFSWGDTNYIISGKTGAFQYNGAYYALGYNVYDGFLSIIKRTTPGAVWTLMDNANRPDPGYTYDPFCVQHGSTLTVIYDYLNTGAGIKEVKFATFDLATDTWSGSPSGSGYSPATISGGLRTLGVSPLSASGEFVVFFRADDASGNRDLYMGRYSGASWATRTLIQAACGSLGVGEVLHHTASGKTHFIWTDGMTITAPIKTRAADASWTLGTTQTVSGITGIHVENAAVLGTDIFVGVHNWYTAGANRGRPAVIRGTVNSTSPTWTVEEVDTTQQYNTRGPSLFLNGSQIVAFYSPDSSSGSTQWNACYATSTGGGWSAKQIALQLRDANSPYENMNTVTAPSLLAVEPPKFVTDDIFQIALVPATNDEGWTVLFSTVQAQNFSPFRLTYIPYFFEAEFSTCCCADFAY